MSKQCNPSKLRKTELKSNSYFSSFYNLDELSVWAPNSPARILPHCSTKLPPVSSQEDTPECKCSLMTAAYCTCIKFSSVWCHKAGRLPEENSIFRNQGSSLGWRTFMQLRKTQTHTDTYIVHVHTYSHICLQGQGNLLLWRYYLILPPFEHLSKIATSFSCGLTSRSTLLSPPHTQQKQTGATHEFWSNEVRLHKA